MRSSLLLLCTLLLSSLSFTYSQTAIQTSFESSDGYNPGNINGQNGWSVTSGDVAVSNAAAKTGTQSVKFSAGNTALLAKYTAYSGTVTGLRNEVYADLWIKPVAFTTKGLTINGDDLFGGSTKRIFMIEFTTDNKIKVYNGSSGSNAGTWTANQWIRISVKADFSTEKYNVAFDGVVAGTDFAFRETYAPTTSGSREAGVKEFHSLRFNHSSDSQTATSEAYIDDIYVGTNPIADVSFGASSTARTITVTQPDYGTISLSPAKSTYNLGDEVTATLTLPSGYTNLGWTGSLSGTELSKNFTVTGNMTIGANTGIDSSNPPPKYTITINPPENAQITLSPTSADNTYYKETKVTATITYEPCYQFNGWTGNLSGTEISKTFTVTSDMTIGAQIVENTTPSVTRTVTSVTELKMR
ncbi:hypothetical protein FW774_02165 (plasmid) [Pedobacter sp. BS3]|uniref:InlB B-repeat-containing protein n=1 Tax=Pedobacter sp. BS3 TaxID=2567937 RepID=UPI0011ED1EF2|nr:hypothetical protein [Pedobacter sp. BS3]TZF85897.1 hypothetical protein FW774_02165 [Pedobacter sp. BS3]